MKTFARNESGHLGAVCLILRIFASADFFGKGRTADKQHYKQQAANDAPVENAYAGAYGENVEANPD